MAIRLHGMQVGLLSRSDHMYSTKLKKLHYIQFIYQFISISHKCQGERGENAFRKAKGRI